MAIFCLATSLDDLQARLRKIVVGETRSRELVHAEDIQGFGALAVLLKDAFAPNLVQTLEHNPALIHGGPFANIAHGCNSVIATRAGLKMADYVVTEAGFGADLGAEKFFNIKCRKAGLNPEAAVVVATARALKMHGGVDQSALTEENLPALEKGCANLVRHIENVKSFGVPVIVGVNRFTADTDAEIDLICRIAEANGVTAVPCTHWSDGGAGAEQLAREVAALVDRGQSNFAPLYPDSVPLWQKIRTVATRLYRADDIIADKKVRDEIHQLEELGYGDLPVCIAKTQYSFSSDPNLKNAPDNHVLPVREIRLAAGAGFLVVVCGDIMTMPGLPREPAANRIGLDEEGKIVGLF